MSWRCFLKMNFYSSLQMMSPGMCSISVWLYWGYGQVLLPAESEENYKSFRITCHDSLSSLHHFGCLSPSAELVMLPSSLTHSISIEVPPLFYSSPCEWALLLSHLCGSTSLSYAPVQDLTVHGITSLNEAPCYSPSDSSLAFHCPDFNENKQWVRVNPAYQLKVVSSCFLRHTHVPLAPAHVSAVVSALLGASTLALGPSNVCSDSNNVFNGLPGLKTIWIPCRSVSHSLSSWRAEPTEALTAEALLERNWQETLETNNNNDSVAALKQKR